MKNYKSLLTGLLIFYNCWITAQQIQITIIPASEYTLARRDEWKVLVNNTTNQTMKVFFYGIATEAQRGKVYEARSKDREIVPGVTSFGTHYYVGLEPFTTLYEDQALRQYAIQTNGLPAGDYEICITAFSALDSSELGSSCYNFSADYFTPPVLVTPDNNDTVCELYPFFTWLPPVPNNGQNFTYTLTLYELQNVQTVLSSAQTNPPFYEKKGISTPITQYGINARNLRPGYRYAWKVSAEVNSKTVATSEVWSFVYCKSYRFVFASDTTKKQKPTKKNEAIAGIPYMELKAQTGSNYSIMDKGKLNFQYNNRYEQKQIGYRILDSRLQLVHNEVLDVNYGLNFYNLDMKSNGKLASGKFYELQVTDPKGNILKARFKYLQ